MSKSEKNPKSKELLKGIPPVQNEVRCDYGMIYLAACVLNDREPDKNRISCTDTAGYISALYVLSQFHGVQVLIYEALSRGKLIERIPKPLAEKWRQDRDKSVRKELLMDAERQHILEFLERKRIWYCPLKGILLKKLYSRPGLRQMADNDILYDVNGQAALVHYMKESGYRDNQIGKGAHDVFMKPPFYNFEMHRELFDYTAPELRDYYKGIKGRLVRDGGNRYGYHLSDEDFYVYLTAHGWKHYEAGGTGIRFLMDQFLYLQSKRECMDFKYIGEQLERLGMAAFEKKTRRLAYQVLEAPERIVSEPLDPDLAALLDELLVTGIYGTPEACMTKRMERFWQGKAATPVQKMKYLLSRCFPPMEYYRSSYPVLSRYRSAIPFLCMVRLVKALIVKNRSIRTELKKLFKNLA